VPVENQIRAIIESMATFHISEAEAIRDFAGVLARIRTGAEVVIESGNHAIAVVQPSTPPRRTISECLALLPEDSTSVMDDDFAADVQEFVDSHREPLDTSAWD